MFQHLFDPKVILVTWPVLLFSLSLHEFLHAWMADRLGDPTARYKGRLMINPIAHYDPIGTTMGLLFGIGWAKPVPVNAAVFRWPKRDMMLTALGGPAANFALAVCFAVVFKLLFHVWPVAERGGLGATGPTVELVEKMAAYGVLLNLSLAIFNLIPLYPLDGHHILRGFLSFHAALAYDKVKYFGSYILVFLIVASSSGLVSIISRPVFFLIDLAFTDAEYYQLYAVVSPLLR